MNEIQKKNKMIQNIQDKTLPLKSSHKDDKHRFSPASSKARSIKGFGENIS
jgi:hypothetical protein